MQRTHDRASLQVVTRIDTTDARPDADRRCVPTSRYSYRLNTTDSVTFDATDAVTFDATDARPDADRRCVPTSRYSYRLNTTDAVTFDATDARIARSYKGVDVLSLVVKVRLD